MQRASPVKKSKPRHGGRKTFFHRLWCRIQGIVDGTEAVENSAEKKVGKAAANAFLRELERKYQNAPKKHEISIDSQFSGSIPLKAVDDNIVLSSRWCILRSKCITVFSSNQKDVERSKKNNANIVLNQVGVRCTFCGILDYPTSFEDLRRTVSQWDTEHFSECPNIPSGILKDLQSRIEDECNPADDIVRYWSDAAREIGIAETKQGLFFERDPSTLSPAVRLADSVGEKSDHDELISNEEKSSVPHSVFLMMRQGRRCTLNKSDQSKGLSDRRLNYPGICCRHCSGEDDGTFIGRFFPHTKKAIIEKFPHSFYTHILACSKCPKSVKNSLRYLDHRGFKQEKELGRHWKKRFYSKTWKWLHDKSDTPERMHSFTTRDEDPEVIEGDASSTTSDDSAKPNYDFIRIAALWLIDQKNATT